LKSDVDDFIKRQNRIVDKTTKAEKRLRKKVLGSKGDPGEFTKQQLKKVNKDLEL